MSKLNAFEKLSRRRSVYIDRFYVTATGPVVVGTHVASVARDPDVLLETSVNFTTKGWSRAEIAPNVVWSVWSSKKRATRILGGLFATDNAS
jgi:hypothetical protein